MPIQEVAKKEGVVRGTLYNHAKLIPPPPYFVFLEGGKIRIDIDHPDFKRWLFDYQSKRNYRNQDKIRFEALRVVTVEAIKEVFQPDQETLNNLLKIIANKFTEAVNG